ncbi:hypothetical protein HRbin34_00572 [bacterium HR34]|nr:hypothetical protein HRbin34_00572 [bacterium HR34]
MSLLYGRDEKIHQRYFENLEKYKNKFGFYGISPALSDAVAPPYVYDNTNQVLKPPYITTSQYFERKMASYITMYLKEKSTYDYSFIFTTMYPPPDWSEEFHNLSSVDDYKNWIKNVYLKEVVELAKLAEKWGFDFFNPLPLEIERLLSPFNPKLKFLSSLKSDELEQLGQWTINEVADAARPYFTGKLILPRYPFNKVLPSLESSPEPTWENLDMSKYDLISFSLIPECDLPITKEFAKTQLNYYSHLAKKYSKPWGLGEIDVFVSNYERCGYNIEEVETNLLKELISILEKLDNQPNFVFFGVRNDASNPQNPVDFDTPAFDLILNYIKKNFNTQEDLSKLSNTTYCYQKGIYKIVTGPFRQIDDSNFAGEVIVEGSIVVRNEKYFSEEGEFIKEGKGIYLKVEPMGNDALGNNFYTYFINQINEGNSINKKEGNSLLFRIGELVSENKLPIFLFGL